MNTKATGFTLIELLVVIAIISLLVSILVPSLRQAKTLAIQIKCLVNLRSTSLALLIYASDHEEYLPGVRMNWGYPYRHYARVNMNWGDSDGHYAGPVGVGLLHEYGYLRGPDVYYCPGRSDHDYFAWDKEPENWGVPMTGASWMTTSYFVAASNVFVDPNSGGMLMDYGKWHRLNRTDPTKMLAFDVCVQDGGLLFGAKAHGHGMGYNFTFFDGSAR